MSNLSGHRDQNQLTEAEIDALRDRYSPQPVPPCPVCGGRRRPVGGEAGRFAWACEAAADAPLNPADLEHYNRSRTIITNCSDLDVIRALADLEYTRAELAAALEDARSLRDARDTATQERNDTVATVSRNAVALRDERDALGGTLDVVRALLAPALAARGTEAPWDSRGRNPRDIWAADGRFVGELDREEDVTIAVALRNALPALAALLGVAD